MYVIKARCAFSCRAASCAKEVKVVFGLDGELPSTKFVSESEASGIKGVDTLEKSPIGAICSSTCRSDALSAAGFPGWKYRYTSRF